MRPLARVVLTIVPKGPCAPGGSGPSAPRGRSPWLRSMWTPVEPSGIVRSPSRRSPIVEETVPTLSAGTRSRSKAGFVETGSTRSGLVRTAVVVSLSHALVDAYAGVLPPLLPRIMDKLGLSIALAATLAMTFSLASSLLQPILGWIADHYGRRMFIVGGPLLSGIFVSLIGTASTFEVLLGLLIVAGLGSAAFHPPGASPRGPGRRRHRKRGAPVRVLFRRGAGVRARPDRGGRARGPARPGGNVARDGAGAPPGPARTPRAAPGSRGAGAAPPCRAAGPAALAGRPPRGVVRDQCAGRLRAARLRDPGADHRRAGRGSGDDRRDCAQHVPGSAGARHRVRRDPLGPGRPAPPPDRAHARVRASPCARVLARALAPSAA